MVEVVGVRRHGHTPPLVGVLVEGNDVEAMGLADDQPAHARCGQGQDMGDVGVGLGEGASWP